MCNVYRRFFPNFAKTAAPLNELLRKQSPAALPDFTKAQRESFQKLKQALAQPPIPELPKPYLPYSVDTDACNDQIGCALFQKHEDGTRHAIGFWSRSLSKLEKNYSATERECLALIWAVLILRPYLEGRHFHLYADHQVLCWMMNLSDVSSRLACWRLRLLGYDFTIHYGAGSANSVADAISRLPTYGETLINLYKAIPLFNAFMVGTCQEINPTNIQLPAEHEVLDVEARISEEESNIEEGCPFSPSMTLQKKSLPYS